MTLADIDEAILAHIRSKSGPPRKSERLLRIAQRVRPDADPAKLISKRLVVLKRARVIVLDRARTGAPGSWREAWRG